MNIFNVNLIPEQDRLLEVKMYGVSTICELWVLIYQVGIIHLSGTLLCKFK